MIISDKIRNKTGKSAGTLGVTTKRQVSRILIQFSGTVQLTLTRSYVMQSATRCCAGLIQSRPISVAAEQSLKVSTKNWDSPVEERISPRNILTATGRNRLISATSSMKTTSTLWTDLECLTKWQTIINWFS